MRGGKEREAVDCSELDDGRMCRETEKLANSAVLLGDFLFDSDFITTRTTRRIRRIKRVLHVVLSDKLSLLHPLVHSRKFV